MAMPQTMLLTMFHCRLPKTWRDSEVVESRDFLLRGLVFVSRCAELLILKARNYIKSALTESQHVSPACTEPAGWVCRACRACWASGRRAGLSAVDVESPLVAFATTYEGFV